MTAKEALDTLKYEIEEEGHCSYIEDEMRIVFAALEKQIPARPTIDRWKRIKCINGHNQPVQRYKYCPMCGQLIDWKGVPNDR